MTTPEYAATCDGYEWRGEVPWKCRLPLGHKGSCKGDTSAACHNCLDIAPETCPVRHPESSAIYADQEDDDADA